MLYVIDYMLCNIVYITYIYIYIYIYICYRLWVICYMQYITYPI